MRQVLFGFLAALAPLASALAGPAPAHFADADKGALVSQGKQIYRTHCAACHGRNLEGQPLWQVQDQYARRRAPAHDASGHTWQHSDDDLFAMTKYGRFPGVPKTVRSYMPAFEKRLPDAQILAVLAYIKADWPLGIRVSQSLLNPHFRGMPRDANKVAWTLPPICTASYTRWRVISR